MLIAINAIDLFVAVLEEFEKLNIVVAYTFG